MARALVNEPDVLLLDEPLGALDLQLRLRMQVELRRLQKTLGSTFIFVTHDQGEAITMSDRIAVMNGGQLVQVGSPTEVYETPSHRFVAEFMGHANLIAGTVRSCADGYGVIDAAAGPIEGRCRKPLAPGTKALASVRYEKVEVAPAGSASAGVLGRILDIRYMGASVRIETAVGSDGLIIHSDMPGLRTAALAVGQAVSLTWLRESVVLLES